MTATLSIQHSFNALESFLSECRINVAQSVSSEKVIERQLELNKDMAQTWLSRIEEKTARGDQKLAAVATQQHAHHTKVVANFEDDLKRTKQRNDIETRLINQLDQITERFRILNLLLTPIPDLSPAMTDSYARLVEDLAAVFKSRIEGGLLLPAAEDHVLADLELRTSRLEAETVNVYDSVPATELERLIGPVISEKMQAEEERRRNQQMVETWKSRAQRVSDLGEDALAAPAASRKLTYEIKVLHIDKSLQLLTTISLLLQNRLQSERK